ncbi:MAG TPA: glycosyltransferase family 4 protein [Thiobacillaceae bacterium]|nr:glycosyltransferase family 4 protein [Thiobacillaceae bacterium]HNU62886.1 glycosyltransferase family 4 protein [Thiobacillaceae bacterium]
MSVLFGAFLGKELFDIDWVVFDPEPSPAWRQEIWNGANAYWIGRANGEGIGAAINTKRMELVADLRTFWMALRGDYDLIQVRDKFVSAVLCLIAAKLRKRCFIYWLSYPFPESRVLDAREGRARIPTLSWLAGRISGWLLYRIIMPAATHIFVQSEQMRQDVCKHGISRDKMTPVPMGVDESLLALPRQKVQASTILYLGTMARIRRLEILLEAMKRISSVRPDASLVLVGEGDSPRDRAFLEAEAHRLGVAGSVEFLGRMPMREALAEVGKAAVCVSPFYPNAVLRSASPTKLIEYMAQGRPVVANDHPEQRAVIEDSGAGICVAWSAEAFADAIIDLLNEPDRSAALGARGPEWVMKNRTYRHIAERLAAQYLEISSGCGKDRILRRTEHQ